MDLLKYKSFPEIGAAVRAVSVSVVEAWLVNARQTVPSAGGLSEDELRDHLGNILLGIATTLESDQPMTLSDLIERSAQHGDARFAQHYNLSELLTEYIHIRPILIEHVSRHMARSMDPTEVVALNLAVDVIVKQGVLAFAEHQGADLRSSMEARAKYLSFLSHDLRGGLNGILLMIEVLRRDLQPHERFAESVQDLDSMRRSILDTVGTMDRFLHAEKLRNKKITPKMNEVDLHALVGDLVNQFTWQAKEQGVNVTTSVPDDGIVTTDRELLQLILQNLLSNAIKYGKGKPVKIDVERVSGSDGPVRVRVSDSGPGIAAEHVKRIFAPFSRGETHGKDGTGLGLSIARMSADLLGATLWVESVVGKGSVFLLDIPKPKT
jgi:signal transduction histidine kinase